ncbi:MAG: PEP-CTERM system TPR-repeat protein PrsT [Halieaceae bacterium]|nr:PEP-CTERM system TPR-repeat protein PrsT [Halieaceae bacterium]
MRNGFAACLLLVLVACDSRLSSDVYMARAKDYLAQSDAASATIELQNALQQDPSQAEARWLLGEIFLGSGNLDLAEHEFQRAEALGWPLDDVRPAISRVYLAQGDFDAVLALEKEGLGAVAAATLLSGQALAANAQGKVGEANELLKQARETDPDSEAFNLAGASIFMNQGEYEQALVLVEAALEKENRSEFSWRLKGQVLMRLERYEEARAALDQSIKLSNSSYADRVARALLNIRMENYEAAQEDASILLEMAPRGAAANYIHGALLFQARDFLGASSALRDAETLSEEFPIIPYYLAISYLIEGNEALSQTYARKFYELAPESGAGRKLFAITLMQLGNMKDARDIVRPVVESSPNDLAALNIMGNAYLMDDNVYAGMVLYDRIAELDPDWAIVPLRDEASLVFRDFGDDGPARSRGDSGSEANFPQDDILKIQQSLADEDYTAAVELAKSYQFRDLEQLSPVHLLARVYMAGGDNEKAREIFGNALARSPGDSFSNQNLARMALENEDPAAVRAYYEDILKHNRNDFSALLQVAALDSAEGNFLAMVTSLKRAIKAHPDTVEPRLNLARHYLATGNAARVEGLLAPLSNARQRNPAVLEVRGLALLQQGRYTGAVEQFEQLVKLSSSSARLHYLLAIASSGAGDGDLSKKELLRAVEADPEYMPALTGLARMAYREEETEEFTKYVEALAKLAPESPDVIMLQALKARNLGDSGAALALFKQAYEIAPTAQTALELAKYYKALGRNDDAVALMQEWIKDHPRDVNVQSALASHFQATGDTASATFHYQKVLAINPNNVIALNNLAWNMRDVNILRAMSFIERAVALSPAPAVLDTQAYLQHLAGDNVAARYTIRQALADVPDEPSMRYHSAMIDAALGDKAVAIDTLIDLTAQDAAIFPERAEALELLQSLQSEAPQ